MEDVKKNKIIGNKNVLITGGSSGLGAETIKKLAQNGANIIFTFNKNKKGAEEVLKEISKYEGKYFFIKADLTKDKDCKKVIDFTREKFKKLDILINNAGGYIEGDEWDGEYDIWSESIKQNLLSVLSVTKYATKIFFKKQKSGIVLNISSIHGINSHDDAITYSISKAGIIKMTEAYKKLFASFGGSIIAIAPSSINCGYWLTASKKEIEEKRKDRPDWKLIPVEKVVKKIFNLINTDLNIINGKNYLIK
jgi:NAD(P)-dependent dehydrogenase (short-subunit alcohol dehydrogenase family)